MDNKNSKPVTFSSKVQNPQFAEVFDVEPNELYSKSNEVVMVDVREIDEYVGELGHIDGADLFVLGGLPQRLQELPKDKTIVFVCRSGVRSAQAASYASQNGYKSVYNMQGGMILWNKLNLPISKNSPKKV